MKKAIPFWYTTKYQKKLNYSNPENYKLAPSSIKCGVCVFLRMNVFIFGDYALLKKFKNCDLLKPSEAS